MNTNRNKKQNKQVKALKNLERKQIQVPIPYFILSFQSLVIKKGSSQFFFWLNYNIVNFLWFLSSTFIWCTSPTDKESKGSLYDIDLGSCFRGSCAFT